MTDPIFDKHDEIASAQIIRAAVGRRRGGREPSPSAVTAAVCIINNTRPAPPTLAISERGDLVRREMDLLEYIHDGADDKPDIPKSHTHHLKAINDAIWDFNQVAMVIREGEAHDTLTPYTDKLMDPRVLSIRRVAVEWLEAHQWDYYYHPVTKACQTIAGLHFAALKCVEKYDMNSDEWEQFHAGVHNLHDKCTRSPKCYD